MMTLQITMVLIMMMMTTMMMVVVVVVVMRRKRRRRIMMLMMLTMLMMLMMLLLMMVMMVIMVMMLLMMMMMMMRMVMMVMMVVLLVILVSLGIFWSYCSQRYSPSSIPRKIYVYETEFSATPVICSQGMFADEDSRLTGQMINQRFDMKPGFTLCILVHGGHGFMDMVACLEHNMHRHVLVILR